ncbi:MAG: hypothetical protein ACYC1U_00545 [Candidatus Aquicultorales bacterium]
MSFFRMLKKPRLMAGALIFGLLLLGGEALGGSKGRKVVFVAVDNITWKDIKEAADPNFDALIKDSSIGLLNNRVHRNATRGKEFVSAGASARSNAPDEVMALDVDETYEGGSAGATYERRTGSKPPGEGAVALSLADINLKNSKLYYQIVPGRLGQALKDEGLKTAVIGNADPFFEGDRNFNREIVYLAMDAAGRVDYSETGKRLLLRDADAPFGARTDSRAVFERFDDFYRKADFIAIDFGDTARADMYDVYSQPSRSLKMKKEAIAKAGAFISKLKKRLGEDDMLIVASVNPPGTGVPIYRGYEEQLTPIVVNGPGYAGGYLTSDSTHRPGLVANLDIAPLVLSGFGIDTPVGMFGRPMKAMQVDQDIDYLIGYNDRAIGINAARPGVIVSFAVIIGVALSGTVAALLLGERFGIRRFVWIFKVAALSVIAFPLASFLNAYFFSTLSETALTALTTATAILFASAAQAIGRNGIKPAAVLAAATLLFLAYDMTTGARFSGDTVFGYDSIVGGRFYGMGNEGISVAVGAVIILFTFCGTLIKKPVLRNIAVLFLGLGVTLIIAFPSFGANLGGAPMGVTATVVYLVVVADKRWRPYLIPAVLGAAALSLLAVIGADVIGGAKTHVGRTAQLISSGGLAEVWLLIKRRVFENLQVFEGSAWSYVLLVIVPLAAILRYRPVGLVDRIFREHPNVGYGFSAALASGLIGYALEDSGIVMPAIILAQFLPLLAYMMLSEGWRADA